MTKTKKQILLEAFARDPHAFEKEFHALREKYERASSGQARMSRGEFEKFSTLLDAFAKLHREQFDKERSVRPLPKKLTKPFGQKPVEKAKARFKRRLK